jgi:hypothetical protein
MLEEIETQYDFEYPALYKTLFNDGMLWTGKYGAKWIEREYPKIKNKPTLALYKYDFELIPIDEIEKTIREFYSSNYKAIKKEPRFIPFAKSGAGDLFAFYLNGKVGEDIPIVFIWHDSDKADILAKNLQDFIFFRLLEIIAELDENSFILYENFTQNCKNLLATHLKYLTQKQRSIVEKIYDRQINLQKRLTYEELSEIREKEGFIENSFIYSDTDKEKRQLDRITGIIQIDISPPPKKGDRLFEQIKRLNWRSAKDSGGERLIIQRKTIFFGAPTIDNIEDTFQAKIKELKESYNHIKITFLGETDDKIYNL